MSQQPKMGSGSGGPSMDRRRVAPITHSIEAEASLADSLPGGVAVPASGSIPGMPGDVRLRHFLLDRKGTVNATMVSILKKHLVKITREASSLGLHPGMVYAFEGDIDMRPTESEWVLIPKTVFARMLAAGQDSALED